MSDVIVVGSANVDLLVNVSALPRPGETVLAGDADKACGGKGANQALAAARSGAQTSFVGAIGRDADGAALRAALTDAGIDVTHLRLVESNTGAAVVVVDRNGENSIVVIPGANATLTELTPADLRAVSGARVLLGQLETPAAAFVQAAHRARATGTRVVLNATPPESVGRELWPLLDVVVLNEHEAAHLTRCRRPLDAVACLLERVPHVVITLGASGAVVGGLDGAPPAHVPAPSANVLDTTGAGDTFCGVLAGQIAAGRALKDAVEWASAAGSLAVERPGAAPAVPVWDAIAARHAATYTQAKDKI